MFSILQTSNMTVVIVIMALVTLATRWGGVFIMSYIPLSDRVQRFIQAMSASVFIALIAPIMLETDMAGRLALITTFVLMLVFKMPIVAMSAGIFAAAMGRQFLF
ncbi:Uncharacterized membrane protein [Acinetobacter marinus]|uniref:Uncharacterized membrane protein n=1 Tax=Acinetobacter marinus TaxID=281375 RepID=A0A1G6MHV4_9GAMM|nr:AzlD domain-containing protein [Acinetobacter marinus]SDC55198.1 Uncharacterized membrane protein [Acinetobacter marinus]